MTELDLMFCVKWYHSDCLCVFKNMEVDPFVGAPKEFVSLEDVIVVKVGMFQLLKIIMVLGVPDTSK